MSSFIFFSICILLLTISMVTVGMYLFDFLAFVEVNKKVEQIVNQEQTKVDDNIIDLDDYQVLSVRISKKNSSYDA